MCSGIVANQVFELYAWILCTAIKLFTTFIYELVIATEIALKVWG